MEYTLTQRLMIWLAAFVIASTILGLWRQAQEVQKPTECIMPLENLEK
jgi:hypothetical protein